MDFENIKGKMVVEATPLGTSVQCEGDIKARCRMAVGVIGALYEVMKENVKPEVENPEKEIRKTLHELVDLGIEQSEINGEVRKTAKKILKDKAKASDMLEALLMLAKLREAMNGNDGDDDE